MGIGMLLALIGLLAAGTLLAWWGIRGRRLNRDPVCRDCGFNLGAFRLPEMHGWKAPTVAVDQSGGAGDAPITVTCPECGGGLKRAKAVRIGERRRMPLVAAAGVLMALIALAPGLGLVLSFASGRSAVKWLPTGILASIATGTSREIAKELESRIAAKSLSQDQLDRVIDRALELQGDWDSRWDSAWGDVFEAAVASGSSISADRKVRWAAQSLNLKVKPRPFVNSRDPIVLRVQSDGSRIHASGNARFTVSFESFKFDGVDVLNQVVSGEQPQTKAYFGVSGTKIRGQYSDSSRDMFVRIGEKPPGTYPFVATLLLQPDSQRGPVSTNQIARRQVFRGTITVRPEDQPTVVPEAPSSSDRDQVRQFLATKEVVLSMSGWSTNAEGKITPNQWSYVADLPWNSEPRIPLSMQVWLIDAEGRRVRIGRLASESYEDESGATSATPRLESRFGAQVDLRGPVSLVFQPDVQIAKETFGLMQYFGEEIRIDNLPLWWAPEYGGTMKFLTQQEAVAAKQELKK